MDSCQARHLSGYLRRNTARDIRRAFSRVAKLFVLPIVMSIAHTSLWAQSQSHQGKEFIFAFLPNSNPNFILELHLTSDASTNATVEYPIGTEIASVAIQPGTPTIVTVPRQAGLPETWQNNGNGGVANAVRVRANPDIEAKISCLVLNKARPSSDAGLALPLEALNNFYIAQTYSVSDNRTDLDEAVIAIIAPYEDTEVTINPSNTLDDSSEIGKPFSISLAEGHAYLLRSSTPGSGGDLTGTIIKANRPVVVVNGNKCARVPLGNEFCDHLFEVAQPIQTWGQTFLLTDMTHRQQGSIYRILTAAEETEVFLDNTSLGVLRKNSFLDTGILSGRHVIRADQPIQVSQFMTGLPFDGNGDPAMVHLPPVEQFANHSRFSTPDLSVTNPYFGFNRVTIFARNGDLGRVTLNGVVIPAGEFISIPGSGYSSIVRNLAPGVHRISSPEPHGAYVWGYANRNSYMAPTPSNLDFIYCIDESAPVIDLVIQPGEPLQIHGLALDTLASEDLNNNGLLDPGEDRNGNGKLDEDSGLRDVFLDPDSNNANVRITVSPFIVGDKRVEFIIERIDDDTVGVAYITAIDLCGNRTTRKIIIPQCQTEILVPPDSLITLATEVEVITKTTFLGDSPDNYIRSFWINDVLINSDQQPDTITATVPLQVGYNRIIATFVYKNKQDTTGLVIPCPDTITVLRVDTLRCDSLVVLSPPDSSISRTDTVRVEALLLTQGGLSPFVRSGEVTNEQSGESVAATFSGDSLFANVALQIGWNTLRISARTIDAFGQETACDGIVRVFLPDPMSCALEITSPANGSFITDSTVVVTGRVTVSGGVLPYADSTCVVVINGDTVAVTHQPDGSFTATVRLVTGDNLIEAICTFTDSIGTQTTCSHSVMVARPPALECSLEIESPSDGSFITDSTVVVTGRVKVSGGVLPYADSTCVVVINGDTVAVTHQPDGSFTATVDLAFGENVIEAICTFTDSIGTTTECSDTVTVRRPESLECSLEITSPADGSFITDSTVVVTGWVTVSGGVLPYADSTCVVVINGDTVEVTHQPDGSFTATVDLAFGENVIEAFCTFTDSIGTQTMCSDTVTVRRPESLECSIEITSPADGSFITDSTVVVTGRVTVSGGVLPYADSTCAVVVNGDTLAVTHQPDGTFTATVPLAIGENVIEAFCTFTDSIGTQTTCSHSVAVVRPPALECSLEIESPADGSFITDSTVVVTGRATVSGGVLPYADSTCVVVINGDTVEVTHQPNGSFTATVPLAIGDNVIEAFCTFTDSIGTQTMCSDTVTVRRPESLECSLEIESPADGSFITDSTVVVTGRVTVSGGVLPYADSTCVVVINGDTIEVTHQPDSSFTATVPLAIGENVIEAFCTFTDSIGTQTMCSAEVRVRRPEPLECSLEIEAPADGSFITDSTVVVTGRVTVSGGVLPYADSTCVIVINGDTIEVTHQPDGSFTATVPLAIGENVIEAICTFTDSIGTQTMCSAEVRVRRPEPLECSLEIEAPADGSFITDSTVVVTGRVTVSGGVLPYADSTCAVVVNGDTVEVTHQPDGSFTATVLLATGENHIEAFCIFTDSIGTQTTCSHSVMVVRPPALECSLEIESPADGSFITDSTVVVTGRVTVSGGVLPYADSTCVVVINGDTIEVTHQPDGSFTATVDLAFGDNVIEATCTFTDSIGTTTECSDRVTVVRPEPLECSLEIESPADGSFITDSTVVVTGRVTVSGGVLPYADSTCAVVVNGDTVEVTHQPDGSFTATVLLATGENHIEAFCTFTDSIGTQTTCSDAVIVIPPPAMECRLEIEAPADGSFITDSTVVVTGRVTVTGGVLPYADSTCVVMINGDTVAVAHQPDGSFTATVRLVDGENVIEAFCTFTDSIGTQTMCSRTVRVMGGDAFVCQLEITEPADSLCTSSDSLRISGHLTVRGGVQPYADTTLTVNGAPVVLQPDGSFETFVALIEGEQVIEIRSEVRDARDSTTVCMQQRLLVRPAPLQCAASIDAPADSARVVADSLEVLASFTASGGCTPYRDSSCVLIVNDSSFVPQTIGPGQLRATVPLRLGENTIILNCWVVDAGGDSSTCTDTVRVFVDEQPQLQCEVKIEQPPDGLETTADSILVVVRATVSGGVAPYDTLCHITVNGDTVDSVEHRADGRLVALVPLRPGESQIVARCTFTDADSQTTSCADSVTVTRELALTCTLDIFSPQDSAFVCADTVALRMRHEIFGAIGPVRTVCIINGDSVVVSDTTFSAVVRNLRIGRNSIEVACTSTDSLGRTTDCRDTIVVFSDPTPPECILDFSQHSDDSATVKGTLIDRESGIWSIDIITLINRNLVFSSWVPGDSVVTFVSKRTGRQGGTSLDLLITNGAGCTIICDPVEVRLEPDSTGCEVEVSVPGYDRYLHIDNYGVHRIYFEVNGHSLLFDATGEPPQQGRVIAIPKWGTYTLDWGRMLQVGYNDVKIRCEGPPGSFAEILIMNEEPGAHLTEIEAPDAPEADSRLPLTFTLHQNYPNPFNPQTTIAFDVPAGWRAPVSLRIYNMNGQVVRVLVDDLLPPGQHRVIWDGLDSHGERVASGIYLYRIVSGQHAIVRKLVLAK